MEGTYTKLDSASAPGVKLLGNVPADGKVAGGTLRHKGWRAESVDLPAAGRPTDVAVIAPAEIEL